MPYYSAVKLTFDIETETFGQAIVINGIWRLIAKIEVVKNGVWKLVDDIEMAKNGIWKDVPLD